MLADYLLNSHLVLRRFRLGYSNKMMRCRCLSKWGLRGGKCLPAGRCSNDWRRRNGRLEPLRYFLLSEIPCIICFLIITFILIIYYAGQSQELPLHTIVGSNFQWSNGCAIQFATFADTSYYHSVVTWSPIFILLCVFSFGVPLRYLASSKSCDQCFACIGGTRSAERHKVGRGIFTCMLLLGSGLQFLLAPVLSFGWHDNVLCAQNNTCALAMVGECRFFCFYFCCCCCAWLFLSLATQCRTTVH